MLLLYTPLYNSLVSLLYHFTSYSIQFFVHMPCTVACSDRNSYQTPIRHSRRFKSAWSRSSLQISLPTPRLAVQLRSRQIIAGLCWCTNSLKSRTHNFVPQSFVPLLEGSCRFQVCKEASGHLLQPKLWHWPVLHHAHRLEALSPYLRSYCKNIGTLLTYNHSAKEVLSFLHFHCSSSNQIILISSIVTAWSLICSRIFSSYNIG